jgi:tetrapyrrole methylase family protein/MazG family protein
MSIPVARPGFVQAVSMTRPALTIVGLGPGDAAWLTVEARDVLATAPEVWLRTSRHPTVTALPHGPRYESFDDVYESKVSFDAVYQEIVARVLALAARPEGVVYAVPGHPLPGEATVRGLLEGAAFRGIAVRIVPGLSFIDAAAAAVGLDPLSTGLLVLDALALGEHRRALVPQRPTLIAQLYDRRVASRAKLALLESYPPWHSVRIISAAGTPEASVSDTTVESLDRDDAFDHLTTLFVPALPPTDDVRSFEGLRAVVARLRAPDGGCPWDLQQTHQTLKRYLVEEAYEALEALEDGDAARLADELGDLLMQVVLHAQIAEDNGQFAIEDVLGSIAAKLIRRHPHVFGDVSVDGPAEVVRNWEQLKQEERGDAPPLDAVPKSLPALAQAQSLIGRASKAGAGPPTAGSPISETFRLLQEETAAVGERELGELLFAVAALAHARDLDAEQALRGALRRYRLDVAAATSGTPDPDER